MWRRQTAAWKLQVLPIWLLSSDLFLSALVLYRTPFNTGPLDLSTLRTAPLTDCRRELIKAGVEANLAAGHAGAGSNGANGDAAAKAQASTCGTLKQQTDSAAVASTETLPRSTYSKP